MIPMLAIVHVRHARGGLRLWIPLFLLWLLLAPLAIVILPFALITAAAFRINPWRASAALAGVTCALTGTRIEVDTAEAAVLVHIL